MDKSLQIRDEDIKTVWAGENSRPRIRASGPDDEGRDDSDDQGQDDSAGDDQGRDDAAGDDQGRDDAGGDDKGRDDS
jgi:hypothetical protein